MQTKNETKTPKTGQSPVTSLWSMQNLSNTPWLMTPFDVAKQKLQTPKTGYKPPVWAFPDLPKAPWFPNLTNMPWMTTPMDVVKQRLVQNPKTGQTPVTTGTPMAVPPTPPQKPSWMPSMETVQQQLWSGANFVTVTLATCVSVVGVQSPVKTMLVNLSKNNTIIPSYSGGILSLAKAMYAGTTASFSGSLVRSGYVTGAKGNSKPLEDGVHEAGKEKGRKYVTVNYSYVAAMALGDILVTQIPESLSTLKKVPGLLPPDFTWKTLNNSWKLMMGGFIPRYGSGMVNFACLCVVEERIAKGLPIQDKNMAHFTSGMLSGMTAAVVSYPLTSFKDYTLVQSTVKDGRLHNASTIKLTQELFYCFISNPGASLKSFGSMALKQVPMRMGLTGIIFALVAGVGETMGSEPLAKVVPEKYQPSSPGKSRNSMFASKQTTPRIEEVQEETNEKDKNTGSKLP